MSYDYLLSICIIVISTKVLSIISGKLHLPQVVGALIAGLLLGPSVLGIVEPTELLEQLAELGVIIIMFSAGIETNIKDLKKSGKVSFIVALFGVVVPLGLGSLLMFIFEPTQSMLENIFIGVVLTATSVSISVSTLKEMGKLSTKVGNSILGAALIDDILGLICLTIITSLAGESVNIAIVLLKILLFFVFLFVVQFIFIRIFAWYDKLVKDKDLRRFPIIAFVLCLFLAWSAEEWFGVADIIGSFFAGLIIASTPKRTYIESKFSPLSYLLLTPIFFANIGLSITFPDMNAHLILFTACLVLIGILSKIIGCGAGSILCGFTKKQGLQIGLGMACRGEVALIVANKGLSMGLISTEYFGSIVILVVACAVIVPIFLKMSFKGESAYEGLTESRLVDSYDISEQIEIVAHNLIENENKRL